MDRNRRKIRIGFWITALTLSALLGWFTAALDPPPATSRVITAIFLTAVAGTSITIDLLWYRAFNRKVRATQSILLEERDPDRYISEISALMAGKRSPRIVGMLRICLATAYCEKRDYTAAKEQMLQANPRKLAGLSREVYWADLAYIHFYLGENAAALQILERRKLPFSKLTEHPHLGGLLAILGIFRLLAGGDRMGAGQLLEQARPRWENERTAEDFAYLEQLCRQAN